MLQGKPLTPPARSRIARRRRGSARVFSIAAFAALMLHAALLGGLPPIEAAAARPVAIPAVRVRAIEPEVEVAAVVASTRQPVASGDSVVRKPRAVAATVDAAPVEPVLPVVEPIVTLPPVGPAGEVAEMTEDVLDGTLPPSDSIAGSTPDDHDPLQLLARDNSSSVVGNRQDAAATVDGDAVPVYPTAVAPSQLIRYHLQRGLLSGTGELSWNRDPPAQPAARYELRLLAKVGGITILTQISSGGFDRAGLAPLRFTDQRLRGSVRAANFQRQRGVISFSGPSVEFPLLQGAQDRLSWMMQVPAILAANPRLATPGQHLTLYVVGARGDASVWVFHCTAAERIITDGGAVDAIKFVREPRKEHDTLAEVWLDPARQYLAVKARIGNPDDGPMLELLRMPN